MGTNWRGKYKIACAMHSLFVFSVEIVFFHDLYIVSVVVMIKEYASDEKGLSIGWFG